MRPIATLALLLLTFSSLGQQMTPDDVRDAKYPYVDYKTLEKLPVPTIAWERPGLLSKQRRAEIVRKIIIPIVKNSPWAISSLTIEIPRYHELEHFLVTIAYTNQLSAGYVIEYGGAKGKITGEEWKRLLTPECEGVDCD